MYLRPKKSCPTQSNRNRRKPEKKKTSTSCKTAGGEELCPTSSRRGRRCQAQRTVLSQGGKELCLPQLKGGGGGGSKNPKGGGGSWKFQLSGEKITVPLYREDHHRINLPKKKEKEKPMGLRSRGGGRRSDCRCRNGQHCTVKKVNTI